MTNHLNSKTSKDRLLNIYLKRNILTIIPREFRKIKPAKTHVSPPYIQIIWENFME